MPHPSRTVFRRQKPIPAADDIALVTTAPGDRSWESDDGLLLLCGGGFRHRCEQIPAAGRLRENALQVFRQQVASVDQALRRVTYLIEVCGLAAITCRDRPARVACRCALALGGRERDR